MRGDTPEVKRRRARAGVACLLLAGLMLGVAGWLSPAQAASQSITSAGPLTNITISDVLNCSVNHTGDTSGEFFGTTACGTFLGVGSEMYGPADVPAGGNVTSAANYHAFTPVSQSAVTGTGTGADPFKIVTVVDAGTTGLRVTETDSYVVGQETYRTDVTVTNSSMASAAVQLYRAGDCFLQDSDDGFGAVDAATGSVSCVGVLPDSNPAVPGPRIEQWRPLSPGSSYYHASYSQVWAAISTGQPFPNTCRCAELIDNGAGLSWAVTVPANGSATRSHLTSFSPAGNQPLSATKTADAATVAAGGPDGYTITITNPNGTPVALTSIVDTLPAGFTYTAGSTTGATTANPTVAGSTLTWAGPFNVPANGNTTLHFGVTVSSTPGTYFNNAGANSDAFAVAPSGDTAPITVTAATTTTTTGGTTTTSTTIAGGTTTTSTTSTTIPGGTTTTSTTIAGGTTTTSTTSTTVAGATTTTTSTSTSTTTTTRPTTTTTTSTSTTSTTVAAATTTSTSTTTAKVPTANDNPSFVIAGQPTTVFGGNFPANTPLNLNLLSDPVFLGTTMSDANGNYSVVVTIPVGTALGVHNIVVTGGGAQATTVINVVPVASSVVLARTGGAASRFFQFAAWAVGAGGLFLLIGARGPDEVTPR